MNKTNEYDVYKELEQAKEIIKTFLQLRNGNVSDCCKNKECPCENPLCETINEQAEQFLKEEGTKTKEDIIIEKYNLPKDVTECWEVVTAYGEVAYYKTGEIEYAPYHYGPFGLLVKPMPKEKVYNKTLWGFDPFRG